jgi:benzylsuccinate CoA-transferase BbsF subunit
VVTIDDRVTPGPLAGIRVLEFGQAIAAPTCGRYLSALGAEVIKIENLLAPDLIRAAGASWLPPDIDPRVRFDVSPMGAEYVSGKMSAGLNITHPKGRPLLERLIALSDVVMINYSASAIRGLHLRAEDVAAIKPDIIYIGLPGFGYDESAPYFTYKAWGPNQAPIAGIDHLTGWPDRPPSGLGSFSYPDFTGGMQAALSIITAVLHHDMTGEGQLIDMSQLEVAVAAIGPVMADYFANGVSAGATGNQVPWAAPQGSYPAEGQERWLAISCWQDAHWAALCAVAGDEAFVHDARFATMTGRLEHAGELDAALGAWTAKFRSRDLVYRLQQAGCPAGLVADQADLLVDPQLEARRAFSVADNLRLGKDLAIQFPVHLWGTPAKMPRGAPAVGEDNTHVFEEVVGLSPEEHRELAAEGVLFDVTQPEQTFKAPNLRWVRHLWRDDWPEPARPGS